MPGRYQNMDQVLRSLTESMESVDSSGGVFTTAGSDFTAAARAVLWSAADDSNGDGIADNHSDADPTNNADLSDNGSALNYGQEITTQSVLLGAALYRHQQTGQLCQPHRFEIGCWRLEVGGWRLDIGYWRLEVGRRISNIQYRT